MTRGPRISLDRLWVIVVRISGLLGLAYEGVVREPDPFMPMVPVWLGLMGLANFVDLDRLLRGRNASPPKEPDR